MQASPEIRGETEDRECTECGGGFTAAVTVAGSMRIGPTLCLECEQVQEEAERSYGDIARNATATLDRMRDLGVNTRVHGALRLSDLDTPGARIAEAWVGEVERAGRHGFVRGLYFEGPTGTGKTQVAASIVRELIESGYTGRIVYDRARALVTSIQDQYGHNGSDSVDAMLSSRRKAGVWILDDIGAEKETPDAFRIVADIVDSREGHPTVLTSNLSPEELARLWADRDSEGRGMSRLGPQNYQRITIDGEDRRFRQGERA